MSIVLSKRLTSACCRTGFPLSSKLSGVAGVSSHLALDSTTCLKSLTLFLRIDLKELDSHIPSKVRLNITRPAWVNLKRLRFSYLLKNETQTL